MRLYILKMLSHAKHAIWCCSAIKPFYIFHFNFMRPREQSEEKCLLNDKHIEMEKWELLLHPPDQLTTDLQVYNFSYSPPSNEHRFMIFEGIIKRAYLIYYFCSCHFSYQNIAINVTLGNLPEKNTPPNHYGTSAHKDDKCKEQNMETVLKKLLTRRKSRVGLIKWHCTLIERSQSWKKLWPHILPGKAFPL